MAAMSDGQSMGSQQQYSQGSEARIQPEITLSDEEISARAYQIYENEGRSDGKAMDHWFRAESELRAERSGKRQGSEENKPRSQRQQA